MRKLIFRANCDYQMMVNFKAFKTLNNTISSDNLAFFNTLFVKVSIDQTKLLKAYANSFSKIDIALFDRAEHKKGLISDNEYINKNRLNWSKLSKIECYIVNQFFNRFFKEYNDIYQISKDLEYVLLNESK